MPVGVRATSAASMSDSTATPDAGASAAKRFLPGPAPSATVSTSVFQASQCGQRPSQRGLVPPQSVQEKSVLSLAMVTNRHKSAL